MKKNKPKELTPLEALGIFIFTFIVVKLSYLIFGEHGALDQEEIRKAKSYYSQEQQKLVKIICDNNLRCWKSEAKILECWKNEAQILEVSEMCKDDVDCWKSVNL